MKNCNDTIGNRTRDFLTCSAVPQPTALVSIKALICTHKPQVTFLAGSVRPSTNHPPERIRPTGKKAELQRGDVCSLQTKTVESFHW